MKARRLMVVTMALLLVFSLMPVTQAQASETVQVNNSTNTSTSESQSQSNSGSTSTSNSATSESTGEAVSKEQLIAKIKELFPQQFTNYTDNDFQLERHRFNQWENDGVERYGIYFHKRVGDDYQNGGFTFAGASLELISYHYSPGRVAEAYFPPKVDREEAANIATAFMQNMAGSTGVYQLREAEQYYGASNRPLTDPVRYDFNFERVENGVPVHSGGIYVSVLGNGDVVSFNKGLIDQFDYQFESNEDILTEEEVLQKIKDTLQLELRYMNDFNYQTQESKVLLVYQPTMNIGGIHAKDGTWYTYQNFVDELPTSSEIKMLVDQALQVEPKVITKTEARALAEKLLDPKDDNVELEIGDVHEYENHLGRNVYSIQYMYYIGNSGTGSSFEIDAETGAIYHFSGYRENEYNPRQGNIEPKISYSEALAQAVEYAKELSPATVHQYAYPVTQDENARYGSYYFTFPRVENGILFSGDSIGVGISSQTGALVSFNSGSQPFDHIPSSAQVVDVEEAKQAYLEKLSMTLAYVHLLEDGQGEETKEYKLIYTFDFGRQHYYNAQTGTWQAPVNALGENGGEAQPRISHPWAEDELNFLVEAGILTVQDDATLDVNTHVTKGEALEIIVKSLTHYWDQPYYRDGVTQTFENIDQNHALFGIVERAVQMKILDTSEKTFAADEKITRQELAFWFVKVLQLHEAAKHSDIYHVDFKDADQIEQKYKGHVALASALGILTASNGYFNPEQEVSIAQLAVATFRLAETVNKTGSRIYY